MYLIMQTPEPRSFFGDKSHTLFQIGKFLFISTVSAGLVWLPQPSAARNPGCNVFGCWEKGGGCNVSGCWEKGGGCNVSGCWEKGGGCNVSGCWEKGGGCNVSGCWDSADGYRRSDNDYWDNRRHRYHRRHWRYRRYRRYRHYDDR